MQPVLTSVSIYASAMTKVASWHSQEKHKEMSLQATSENYQTWCTMQWQRATWCGSIVAKN